MTDTVRIGLRVKNPPDQLNPGGYVCALSGRPKFWLRMPDELINKGSYFILTKTWTLAGRGWTKLYEQGPYEWTNKKELERCNRNRTKRGFKLFRLRLTTRR